jgi:hypothetical protein
MKGLERHIRRFRAEKTWAVGWNFHLYESRSCIAINLFNEFHMMRKSIVVTFSLIVTIYNDFYLLHIINFIHLSILIISVNLLIDNFAYLGRYAPFSPVYVVYILQFIWCSSACSAHNMFKYKADPLTNKLISRGFRESFYKEYCSSNDRDNKIPLG